MLALCDEIQSPGTSTRPVKFVLTESEKLATLTRKECRRMLCLALEDGGSSDSPDD